MNDRTYLENYLLLIMYATGIIFFIVRIIAEIEGDWSTMIEDPEMMKNFDRLQFLIGFLITITFILCVIPRWVNKLKITRLNTIVQYGCIIAVMMMIYFMLPMITGEQLDLMDMKFIGMMVALAVMVVFYIIAYKYGQKHKKDDNGGKKDED